MADIGKLGTPTFRIFLSSTFDDLRAERDALQETVFPRLRTLCKEHGARFQVIDLRWGIAEQAALDQQTVNICLQEIERCQEQSPRPNFLVLLGDRYGWQPPPPQIPENEFIRILEHLTEDQASILCTWYRCDENAVPPEYSLQPRQVGGIYEAYENWQPAETKLQATLADAAVRSGIEEPALSKYLSSATHQEISAGALAVEDAEEHVFCFFRTIPNLPNDPAAVKFSDFVTIDGEILPNGVARSRLSELKAVLRSRLGANVHEYDARWQREGITTDHLDQLCSDVYTSLEQLILTQLRHRQRISVLDQELEAQEDFLNRQAEGFQGREKTLSVIQSYLLGDRSQPFVLWGSSGSGKSATMARAVQQVRQTQPAANVLLRFIGSTPDSADASSLIAGLCQQLYTRFEFGKQEAERLSEVIGYGDEANEMRRRIVQEYQIPSDLKDLLPTLIRFLSLTPHDQPTILVLDGLDQLRGDGKARVIRWLPLELPHHVRWIISNTPGDDWEILISKIPKNNRLELEPMSVETGKILLESWMKEAGRTLQENQKQEILGHFERGAEGLPLYLKLAAQQARTWHSYSKGEDTKLGEDLPALIDGLFDALSSESRHGSMMVSRAIGYLIAARNGLSEDELHDVLSRDVDLYSWFIQNLYHIPMDLIALVKRYLNSPENSLDKSPVDDASAAEWLREKRQNTVDLKSFLVKLADRGEGPSLPVVLWARLYADLQNFLTLRNADGTRLFGFFHRQLEERAKVQFLKEEDRITLHSRLAAYFAGQAIMRDPESEILNERKLSELPYQQTHAGLFDNLKATLLNFDFLDAKVQATGAGSLIEDFTRGISAGLEDEALSLLHTALNLSTHVLDRDRQQLPGQLTGRLLKIENDDIRALLERIFSWRGRIWLRPLGPSLKAPDGALLRTFSHFQGHFVPLDNEHIVIADHAGDLCQLNLTSGEVISRVKNQGSPLVPWAVIDGSTVLVCSTDRAIVLWDTTESSVRHLLGQKDENIRKVVILPGTKTAVSVSEDGEITAWDLETREKGLTLGRFPTMLGGLVVIGEDPTLLSTGAVDDVIRLWDPFIKKDPVNFELPISNEDLRSPGITTATKSKTRPEVALGFRDGSLGLLDLDKRDLVKKFKAHQEWVTAIALFEDNQKCLSGTMHGSIKVWDLSTGEAERTLDGHVGMVESIAITSDGRIAITSSTQNLKLWNLESRPEHKSGERVTAAAIFPNENMAVTASDTRHGMNRTETKTYLKIWDLETGSEERSLMLGEHFWVNDMDVFPDGRRVICAGMYWRQSLVIFDLKTGKALLPLPFQRSALSVSLYKQGSGVVSGGEDDIIRIWDLDSFSEVASMQGHANEINALVCFSEDSKVISASNDATLKIWDLETHQEINQLDGHSSFVMDVKVTSDGRRALSGSLDGTIRIWDLNTGKNLYTLAIDQGMVNAVATMGSSNLIATATSAGSVTVWDSESMLPVAKFMGEGEVLTCLLAAKDGSRLIAGGSSGAVHILELITPDR